MSDIFRRFARAAAITAPPDASRDRSATPTDPTRRRYADLGLTGAEPDRGPRTEYATMLADPVLPTFAPDAPPPGPVVDHAAAAERGLWRDIALARRIESALRESEAFFESLFASVPTPLLVASLSDGRPARFRRVNAAMSRLTGHPVTTLSGYGFADLEHPDQQPAQGCATPTETAGGAEEAPAECIRRWVHADGRDLWVSLRISIVRAGAGHGDQLVCHAEDITARRRAEQVALATEAQFRAAFAAASEPTVLIDLAEGHSGRLLAANRAACELLGRSEFEMMWLRLESLTTASGRPALRKLVDRLASGELVQHDAKYAYQAATGAPGRLRLTVRAAPSPDGRPDHALVTLRDDTVDAAATSHSQAPRLRVLLVEDDVVAQTVAQLLLRRFGHQVDIVGNGLQALEAVSSVEASEGEAPYDVVVMDLQMPVMDGLEATRRIRSALPERCQPLIVALTGASSASRELCLSAGMDGYLSKPVREVDLRGALSTPRAGRPVAGAGDERAAAARSEVAA